jgi:exopolyphosphatase / guanosine-5'-triphosphate,3'-diphosphate pyrophosphatase
VKAAVVEIGTNSVKLAVGETQPGAGVTILRDSIINARLGEGIDAEGELARAAEDRAIAAIRKHVDALNAQKPDVTKIIATAAVREARNADQFKARIKETFGLDLETLTEAEECRLSYAAVALDEKFKNYDKEQVTVDVGGGSTELTFGQGETIRVGRSVKLGAVRVTERFLDAEQPTMAQVRKATEYVRQELAGSIGGGFSGRVVGIGGSAVNLARVWNEVPIDKTEEAHGMRVSGANIFLLIEGMCALSLEKRKTMIGLEPDRADIIIGGAIVVESVLAMLGCSDMIVSIRGVRHGALYQILGLEAAKNN